MEEDAEQHGELSAAFSGRDGHGRGDQHGQGEVEAANEGVVQWGGSREYGGGEVVVEVDAICLLNVSREPGVMSEADRHLAPGEAIDEEAGANLHPARSPVGYRVRASQPWAVIGRAITGIVVLRTRDVGQLLLLHSHEEANALRALDALALFQFVHSVRKREPKRGMACISSALTVYKLTYLYMYRVGAPEELSNGR